MGIKESRRSHGAAAAPAGESSGPCERLLHSTLHYDIFAWEFGNDDCQY